MSIHYTPEDLEHKFAPGGNVGFARHGDALLRDRRTSDAIRILVEGVRRHPGYIAGFLVLGRAYREIGRISEARFEFENALRLDAHCPAALRLLAEIKETKDTGKENAPIKRAKPASIVARVDHFATPVVPVSAPLGSEIEEEDIEEGDTGDAEAVPNVATVTLAEIYFQQGLKEQALQIYRQLLERQPDNETVKKRLREIQASTA